MHESKPELALDYAEYLLTHHMNRDCLLTLPKEKLNELLKVLQVAKVQVLFLPHGVMININYLLLENSFYNICSESWFDSILDNLLDNLFFLGL